MKQIQLDFLTDKENKVILDSLKSKKGFPKKINQEKLRELLIQVKRRQIRNIDSFLGVLEYCVIDNYSKQLDKIVVRCKKIMERRRQRAGVEYGSSSSFQDGSEGSNPSSCIQLWQELEYKDNDPNRLAIGLIKPNSKVLSCGCGNGREVKYLRNINCEVTAIDINKKNLEKSKKVESKIEYLNINISSFKSKDKFDFIICLCNTINDLKDLRERKVFVKNCYDNLKPEGKLIITTSHRFTSVSKFYQSLIRKDNFYFSSSEIDSWFSDTDFKIKTAVIENDIQKENLIIGEK